MFRAHKTHRFLAEVGALDDCQLGKDRMVGSRLVREDLQGQRFDTDSPGIEGECH